MTLLRNLIAQPDAGPAVILRLGPVEFSTSTQAYRELRESYEWVWREQQRLQNDLAWQYVGRGRRSRELSGVIYPGQIGSESGLRQLIERANTGSPMLMTAASGDVLGYWALQTLDRTEEQHYQDGSPRRVAFSMQLVFYGMAYDDLSNAGR